MTITVTTIHDDRPETFSAKTSEQLVGFLWKTAFMQESGPGEYMVEVARRVKLYNGCHVRTDTARHFLQDLFDAGLVYIDWGGH